MCIFGRHGLREIVTAGRQEDKLFDTFLSESRIYSYR